MAFNIWEIPTEKIREKIKEETRNICQKPARLLFSIFVTVFMLVLTAFAWDKGGQSDWQSV